MQRVEIPIQRFDRTTNHGVDIDPNILPQQGFIYCVGKPGSGKTEVIANLLKKKELYKNKFHGVLCVTPTKTNIPLKDTQFYTKVSDLDGSGEWAALSWIQERLDEYREYIDDKHEEECGEDHAANVRPDTRDREEMCDKWPRCNVLIILDDVIPYLKKFEFSSALTNLWIRRRHQYDKGDDLLLQCTIFVTSQKYTLLPSTLRSNMTMLCAYQQNGNDLQTVWAELCPWMSKKEFIEFAHSVWSRGIHRFIQIRTDIERIGEGFFKIVGSSKTLAHDTPPSAEDT